MTDSKALREIIKAKGYKLGFIADYLGLSRYGLALKIDNKREFKTSEVAALCELLHIEQLEVKESIFFKRKVD